MISTENHSVSHARGFAPGAQISGKSPRFARFVRSTSLRIRTRTAAGPCAGPGWDAVPPATYSRCTVSASVNTPLTIADGPLALDRADQYGRAPGEISLVADRRLRIQPAIGQSQLFFGFFRRKLAHSYSGITTILGGPGRERWADHRTGSKMRRNIASTSDPGSSRRRTNSRLAG